MSGLYDDIDAAVEDMVKMYKDGYSLDEIAKEYHRKRSVLYKIFKRRGVKLRDKKEASASFWDRTRGLSGYKKF